MLHAVAVVTVSTVCCSDTAQTCNRHTRHIAPVKVAAQSGGGATSTPWCNPVQKAGATTRAHRNVYRNVVPRSPGSIQRGMWRRMPRRQRRRSCRCAHVPCRTNGTIATHPRRVSSAHVASQRVYLSFIVLSTRGVAPCNAHHTTHTAYDTHLACVMQRTLLTRCKAQRNMRAPSQRALACRMQCDALQLPAIGSPLQTQIEQIRSSLERSHCLGAHVCAMSSARLGSPVPHCSRTAVCIVA